MNFAQRLREALEFRQVRQVDLARSSGISQSQISLYMKGKVKPSLAIIMKISEALSVNVNYLLGLVDTIDKTYLEELLSKILLLSTAQRISVIDYIDSITESKKTTRKEIIWRS